MKRLTTLLAAAALVTPLLVALPATAAPQVQPRVTRMIVSPAGFMALLDDTIAWQGSTITLAVDLDMTGYTFTRTIGTAARPFTSVFDGNLKTISNLTVATTEAGMAATGIFGTLGPGHVIKDFTVLGAEVSGTSTGSSAYVGGIAGVATGGTVTGVVFQGSVNAEAQGTWDSVAGGIVGRSVDDTLTQVAVVPRSSVTATAGAPKAGGIVGYAESTRIQRAGNYAAVSAVGNTHPSTGAKVGGVIGESYDETTSITDSFSQQFSVSATRGSGAQAASLGGIAGSVSAPQAGSVIDRVYAFGPVTQTGFASANAGGLMGSDNAYDLSRSFHDDGIVGVASLANSSADDTGLSVAQQTQFATYSGLWPIVSTWQPSSPGTPWGICNGQGYPYLLWQAVAADPCITGNTISGTPEVGQILTSAATSALATQVPSSLTYEWGTFTGATFSPISGATDDTYVVQPSDAGSTLAVRVTSTWRAVFAVATSATISIPPPPTPPAPPVPSTYPPGQPKGLAAAAGDTSATLDWAAPVDSGSFPITSYQAVASPGGASCLTPDLTCELTGLVNGTTYAVQVRALNGAGWGAWSIPVEMTPEKPVQPTITIAPSQRGRFVRVDGTTTDLPEGTAVTAWVSMGRAEFAPMPKPVLVAFDGSFTWERRRNPRNHVRVYFSAYDRGVIESNTVTFAGRR